MTRWRQVRAANSDTGYGGANSSGSVLFPVSPCPRVPASLIRQQCAPRLPRALRASSALFAHSGNFEKTLFDTKVVLGFIGSS